jgi:hypothetical protein
MKTMKKMKTGENMQKNKTIESYIDSYQENLRIQSLNTKLNVYFRIIFFLLVSYVVIVFTTIELLNALT